MKTNFTYAEPKGTWFLKDTSQRAHSASIYAWGDLNGEDGLHLIPGLNFLRIGFEHESVQLWSSCSLSCTRSVAKNILYLLQHVSFLLHWMFIKSRYQRSGIHTGLVTSRKVKHSILRLNAKLPYYSGIYSWLHLQIMREEGLIYVFVFAWENGNEFHA